MEQIDDITINFLDESIEILSQALQRLKRLREKAERDLSLDYKNNNLIRKMAQEINELKRGVIG